MDAAAEIGRNPVSTRFSLSVENRRRRFLLSGRSLYVFETAPPNTTCSTNWYLVRRVVIFFLTRLLPSCQYVYHIT